MQTKFDRHDIYALTERMGDHLIDEINLLSKEGLIYSREDAAFLVDEVAKRIKEWMADNECGCFLLPRPDGSVGQPPLPSFK